MNCTVNAGTEMFLGLLGGTLGLLKEVQSDPGAEHLAPELRSEIAGAICTIQQVAGRGHAML